MYEESDCSTRQAAYYYSLPQSATFHLSQIGPETADSATVL